MKENSISNKIKTLSVPAFGQHSCSSRLQDSKRGSLSTRSVFLLFLILTLNVEAQFWQMDRGEGVGSDT
jgi:hypothetical protein